MLLYTQEISKNIGYIFIVLQIHLTSHNKNTKTTIIPLKDFFVKYYYCC